MNFDLNAALIREMDKEVKNTRKMLERVPSDKLDWKPHEKSMSMRNLAVHIAEIAGWPDVVLNTEGLDFAKMDYKPTAVSNTQDIVDLLDNMSAKGRAAIEKATEKQYGDPWVMRMGETVISSDNKYENVRHAFAQMIHHRAQLGVYLRLLNIPIPGVYGPSADDNMFG
jgi:uncharacterized damage-inducible protein DinB